jgi:hypothetical protein
MSGFASRFMDELHNTMVTHRSRRVGPSAERGPYTLLYEERDGRWTEIHGEMTTLCRQALRLTERFTTQAIVLEYATSKVLGTYRHGQVVMWSPR